MRAKLDWCKDVEAWESLCDYWCSSEYKEKQKLGRHSRTISDEVAQNKGGSRNFIRTKSFIAKTFGPEQATSINTYKLMKVGLKKYKETGSSSSIENPKAKKRLDDYYDGLKEAYPEDWQERDLDPKVIYSIGGGLPHGRLAIGDSAIKKSEVRAIAKQHNIRPANSLSYQDLLKRHQQLEKRCKTVGVVAKHLKFLYAQSGLPVPEDLEDALMGDGDLAVSSPSNQGGTPPTGSSHAEGCSTTPQSRGLNATPAHPPNDVDGAA